MATSTAGTVFHLDRQERDRLLLQHLPHVREVARRIYVRVRKYVPFDDLVNEGVLGLIKALENYDPNRKVELLTYAKIRIQGAILDSLRELAWSSRTLRRKARQMEQAQQSLTGRLGRMPSETELAAELAMDLKQLQRLRSELQGLELRSLQAISFQNEYGSEVLDELPATGDQDPAYLCFLEERKALLARALSELSPRKRQVLELYYFEDLTMKEVGARLGVGQARVSQIHSAAMARLRARIRQLLEVPPRTLMQGISGTVSEVRIPPWHSGIGSRWAKPGAGELRGHPEMTSTHSLHLRDRSSPPKAASAPPQVAGSVLRMRKRLRGAARTACGVAAS